MADFLYHTNPAVLEISASIRMKSIRFCLQGYNKALDECNKRLRSADAVEELHIILKESAMYREELCKLEDELKKVNEMYPGTMPF